MVDISMKLNSSRLASCCEKVYEEFFTGVSSSVASATIVRELVMGLDALHKSHTHAGKGGKIKADGGSR